MRVDIEFSEQPEEEIDAAESAESWMATNRDDQMYDDWVERESERHAWPSNQDEFLTRLGEDEMERARRRAFIRGNYIDDYLGEKHGREDR